MWGGQDKRKMEYILRCKLPGNLSFFNLNIMEVFNFLYDCGRIFAFNFLEVEQKQLSMDL